MYLYRDIDFGAGRTLSSADIRQIVALQAVISPEVRSDALVLQFHTSIFTMSDLNFESGYEHLYE